MSFRKRLLVFLVALVAFALLDVICAPFLVAKGVRLWLQWAAKRQHLTVEIAEVKAPFLQPVTIRDLRINSLPGAAQEISIEAGALVAGLNFRSVIFSQQSAFIQSLEIDRLKANIILRPRTNATGSLNWRLLSELVPDNFRIDHGQLDLTTPEMTFRLQKFAVGASAIESGKFLAREVTIQSPLLRQTFHDLRGATSWENSRLTIAGIPLLRGLDLETLTLDLSRLQRKRVAIDTQVDAYGGTLRASFQSKAGDKPAIDVAGSASNIALEQIANAFGFVEPISGRIRAAKFTFRGTPGQFLNGTASVWMELANFALREHRADNVMLGATYYDHRLEVGQLYVRQRENQLTINGDLVWPKQGGNWMDLPFRGQINATIPDLNGFAQLLGATTGDFAGALLAEGQIESLAPEARGRLNLRGRNVSFRGVTLDSLGASLQLRGTAVNVQKLEARHAQDFLRAEGEIDLHSPHRFSGRLTGSLNDLGVYAPLLPDEWQQGPIGGGATFDWRGDGTLAASSGTLQFYGQQLRLPIAPWRSPFNVTLEGSYSPQDLFFRTFQVGNDRAWLSGFLMLGTDFIHLQAMQFTLDGVPSASGTIFLPLSVDHWRRTGSWLEALDLKQKFDVDLTVHQLDLRKAAEALGQSVPLKGMLDLRLTGFGPINTLRLTSSGSLSRLEQGTPNDSIDLDAQCSDGRAQIRAAAKFGSSDPLTLSASLPLRLDKKHLLAGTVLDRNTPFSCKVDCPALFLDQLPNEWRTWAAAGVLTGEIDFANTLGRPTVSGSAELLGAELKLRPPWPQLHNVTASLWFEKGIGVIEPLRMEIDGKALDFSGRLTSAPPKFRLALTPSRGEVEIASLPVSGMNLTAVRVMGESSHSHLPRMKSATIAGRLGSPFVSLTIESESGDASPQQTTLFARPHSLTGEALILQSVPSPAISLGTLSAPQIPSR
jgi:hypothetical protein